MLILVLVATACGGDGDTITPTRRPTPIPPTPTVRSTALPDVDLAPALGMGERAITLYFTVVNDTTAQRLANELENDLADELELDFTIELGSEAEALQALCSGRPVAAWISAFSFVKAYETCGALPVFALRRGTPPRVTIGTTATILGSSNFASPGGLIDQTFCRSADHDLTTTWVLPRLILASAGVNPATDLAEIKDLPDDATLGMALNSGVCDAAGLPPNEVDNVIEDIAARLSTESQRIRVSDIAVRFAVLSEGGDTSFPADAEDWEGYAQNVIPYEVLVFAPDTSLPADLREDIADEIETFFTDRTSGLDRTQDLLDADGIITVELNDYAAFRALLDNARWDMTN